VITFKRITKNNICNIFTDLEINSVLKI